MGPGGARDEAMEGSELGYWYLRRQYDDASRARSASRIPAVASCS